MKLNETKADEVVASADLVVTTAGQVLKNRHGSRDIRVIVVDETGEIIGGMK